MMADTERKWYVLRVRYRQGQQACDELHRSNIEFYYPPRQVKRIIRGRIRTVTEPILPSLIFVHAGRQQIDSFFEEQPLRYMYARYFRDKTLLDKDDAGKNRPVVVADRDMDNFIRVTQVEISASDIGAGLLGKNDKINYKPGDPVRVIMGPFVGVEGRVARVKGQQRVIVELPGICKYATSYIATAYLEPVNHIPLVR